MTFVLHWRRDGSRVEAALADRLASGLTKLRDDPVKRWSRGPLTVLSFEDSPGLSIVESPSGFVALLAGRLDDFANLVARLGGSAALGADPTDAELLAAAYERWGDNCFEQLLGDFAAVVWESSRGTLLCARDVVGVAPLYYWSTGDEVVLSGHLGGVVGHPLVRREPNEGYIAEILANDIHSRHETIYEDVWRLVAGHAARFDRRPQPQLWKWGHIEPIEMSSHLCDEEYDEWYRSVLTQAIRDRMRGVAKVGVTLSGGLDSSSVAVLAAPLAAKSYGEPLRSYSLTFPGMACDETPYILEVARSSLIDPVLVASQPTDHPTLRRESLDTLALPDAPNGRAFRPLLALAQEDGSSALLTGGGGDQWFDYEPNFPTFLASRGRALSAWKAASRLSPHATQVSAFAHRAVRPLAGAIVRKAFPGIRPPRPPHWLTSGLVERSHLLERVHEADARWMTPGQSRAKFCESGWEAHVYEANALAALRAGAQFRHPFYDSRLIQFALALDERHRWADGQFRTIQRRALRGLLPEMVRRRTSKAEFSHLDNDHFESASARQTFSSPSVTERDWLVVPEIRRMYEKWHDDLIWHRPPEHAWPLWHVLAVDNWYGAVVSAKTD